MEKQNLRLESYEGITGYKDYVTKNYHDILKKTLGLEHMGLPAGIYDPQKSSATFNRVMYDCMPNWHKKYMFASEREAYNRILLQYKERMFCNVESELSKLEFLSDFPEKSFKYEEFKTNLINYCCSNGLSGEIDKKISEALLGQYGPLTNQTEETIKIISSYAVNTANDIRTTVQGLRCDSPAVRSEKKTQIIKENINKMLLQLDNYIKPIKDTEGKDKKTKKEMQKDALQEMQECLKIAEIMQKQQTPESLQYGEVSSDLISIEMLKKSGLDQEKTHTR